jgi:hypothetical protein
MLEAHNLESPKALDIVLFRDAVEHLSSLCRVLAMLVGVKSSGRKSLARLALRMAGMESFEMQITRTYNLSEWREDMKNLMKQCGQGDLPTGFLLSDVQVVGAFQLEEVSNLLIAGEIPNLFARDEVEQLKADMVLGAALPRRARVLPVRAGVLSRALALPSGVSCACRCTSPSSRRRRPRTPSASSRRGLHREVRERN